MDNKREVILTNRSSTITSGGTAQTAAAANVDRKFLLVQNPPDEIENLVVGFGATAVNDETMLTLEPGAAIVLDTLVPTALISVIAATTGHNFIMYEG